MRQGPRERTADGLPAVLRSPVESVGRGARGGDEPLILILGAHGRCRNPISLRVSLDP